MLSESIRCIPLHSSCLLVGVPPAGCLRVALFVTERYLWSSRPLTSHFLPALFVLIASCAHVQYHRLPPGIVYQSESPPPPPCPFTFLACPADADSAPLTALSAGSPLAEHQRYQAMEQWAEHSLDSSISRSMSMSAEVRAPPHPRALLPSAAALRGSALLESGRRPGDEEMYGTAQCLQTRGVR